VGDRFLALAAPPGRIGPLGIYVAIATIIGVTIWLYVVTVNINDQLVNAVRSGNFVSIDQVVTACLLGVAPGRSRSGRAAGHRTGCGGS